MSAELEVIKVAYEQENMSPEEISVDRGLELPAVKSALMQVSTLYRKNCNKEEEGVDECNFTKAELKRVRDAILDIGMSAEDDNLRFKALIYIRDDSKGRKDIIKATQGATFNILTINERMKQVRQLSLKAKEKAINV